MAPRRRYFFTSPVPGFLQAQPSPGMCGQIKTSSNFAPWLSRICIMRLCGPSKVSVGKDDVPRPSWLETMTSFQPASLSAFNAGRTPSTKRIFLKSST